MLLYPPAPTQIFLGPRPPFVFPFAFESTADRPKRVQLKWLTSLCQSSYLSPLSNDSPMKALLRAFSIVHGLMAALFACAALLLIVIAAQVGWLAIAHGLDREAAQQIIEAVGLLAAAVVALQIAQTIAEEEVLRDAHISGPTRVRRFLSRFLVVIVVALTIEALVATFKAAHDGAEHMLYAASLVLAAGGLLVGWGIFIRMNRYAEELEPEAMADAKREDNKLT